MVALPSPAKYTEWREEEREAANTVFSDPVRTITTAGGNSLSRPALQCGNEPGELERVTRQGEPAPPGVRRRVSAFCSTTLLLCWSRSSQGIKNTFSIKFPIIQAMFCGP